MLLGILRWVFRCRGLHWRKGNGSRAVFDSATEKSVYTVKCAGFLAAPGADVPFVCPEIASSASVHGIGFLQADSYTAPCERPWCEERASATCLDFNTNQPFPTPRAAVEAQGPSRPIPAFGWSRYEQSKRNYELANKTPEDDFSASQSENGRRTPGPAAGTQSRELAMQGEDAEVGHQKALARRGHDPTFSKSIIWFPSVAMTLCRRWNERKFDVARGCMEKGRMVCLPIHVKTANCRLRLTHLCWNS